MEKSQSELQLKHSTSFLTQDLPTFGFHPTAVGPQLVGYTKHINMIHHQHMLKMILNSASNMDLEELVELKVKTQLPLLDLLSKTKLSEKPPLLKEFLSLPLNSMES